MKVLFCTDGSKISFAALSNFLNWVSGVTVDVLSVADWSFLPDDVSVEGSDFAVKCANSAESILEYSENFIKERNANFGKAIKMCGVPIDAILEVEDGGFYDCLVMGSNGKKGFQKWLGSVSQELASVSKTSTFISKEQNKHSKILFTVDSSDLSRNVIEKSLDMLYLKDKEIILLTVYEMPDYLFLEGNIDSNWVYDVENKQKRESLQLLSKYEKLFEERDLKVESKSALKGSPAQTIVKYAHNNQIDLVVSGVRTKKYYSRFFMSSVSKRVLENVNSDVLIVRP